MLNIKVIGHRGAPGIYPENTISSIIKAIELKVDGVEVDVRSTSDNVLVLFHDEKLDRLIGVSKYLSEVTYDYLSKLKLRGERIPKLDELLPLIKHHSNIMFFIEIKEPGIIFNLLKMLEDNGIKDNVALISFYHNVLKTPKSYGFKVGAIFACRPLSLLKYFNELKPDYVIPRHDVIDIDLVEEAHSMGAEVVAWVVNDKKTFLKMKELKVDWIATDYPDKITRLVHTNTNNEK